MTKPQLVIFGLLTSLAFQRAKTCAMQMYKRLRHRFRRPIVHGMFEVDWEVYMADKRRNDPDGSLWSVRHVVVWVDGLLKGDDSELVSALISEIYYNLPQDRAQLLKNIARDHTKAMLRHDRLHCVLDVQVGDRPLGKLHFELYSELMPITCTNFSLLCDGKLRTADGDLIGYKGTLVHRIVRGGFIQCGDVENRVGGGGSSALGAKYFPDEGFFVSHDRRGILSMCPRGGNDNSSQFVVTLDACPWMDKRMPAFGRLVEGWEALRMIERVPTRYEVPLALIQFTSTRLVDTQAMKPKAEPCTPRWEPTPPAPSLAPSESSEEWDAIIRPRESVIDERDVVSVPSDACIRRCQMREMLVDIVEGVTASAEEGEEDWEQWPGEGQYEWLGEGQQQWPYQGQYEWPGEGQQQWPGQGQYEWPGEGQQQWPYQGQYEWPGEGQQQWPGEGQQQWPVEGQQQWPVEGQQEWPGEGQQQWPVEGQQEWPGEGQQQWPVEGQQEWPAEVEQDDQT